MRDRREAGKLQDQGAAGSKPRRWLRRLGRLALAASVLLLAAKLYTILLGHNFHVVVPGKVYRSGQLSGSELEHAVQQHGIRTIINLRGHCPDQDWYWEEGRTAHRRNVAFENICLSATRFPSSAEMLQLVDVLDHADYPVLIHCKQGADRTGIVSALVRLLQTDATPSRAGWQLSPYFGHLPVGRTALLDQYFDVYVDWLRQRGEEHSSASLRRWLADETGPGMYRCRFEPLDFPVRLPANKPALLNLRLHNVSQLAWHFRPESNAGVHAFYCVSGGDGQLFLVDRAGRFDAQVAPGQSIDLKLGLPALAPGRYRLKVDLLDESCLCSFVQVGSEALEWPFDVE